ncbi:MAG TPA: hypothetical protein VFE58_01465 [Tepidisphaeraceae bacterium]|jgi:hypothetical protein|nr:hypothetical protein [Tepidisphaeraceae bacterium]
MGPRLKQFEQVLERRWRGGHPFRPRLSWRRRVGMMALFILLCAVIGTYWYLTDANRVRAMAETYLTKVLGGRVDVGQANLSIFEGLRLDDVRVHVDQTGDDDSVLFRAKTFKVNYNPRALLSGQIEASQIVAIGPELRLVQDRETGEWNYQQMIERARQRKKPTTRRAVVQAFPEILLRDGQVENGEVANGEYRSRGTLGFEGRLSPSGEEGRYTFEIQCHGPNDPVGPAVSGWVVPDTGQVRVTLRNFAFGRDIRGMLPFEVRQWWVKHGLAGTIDSTEVAYTPERDGKPADWRVETSFKGVTLRIRPEEWRSPRQNLAIERIHNAVDWPQTFSLGSSQVASALLFKFTRSVPINLERGAGTLAFDRAGLEIKDLRGFIEGSSIRITGRYDGFTPDAGVQLHIESLPPENITLADEPRFIWSMPTDAQENWLRFHPVGTCTMSMDVTRAGAGESPRIKAVFDVIDGKFTCDRFPYTCRKPKGQILLDVDPDHGGGNLVLKDLWGYGQLGTPNENKIVRVKGVVDHLGPDPGMHLEISADDLVSDPLVLGAIPLEARGVVTLFDAPGKGEYPRFEGGFKCWIDRPPGKDKHIDLNIDLDIRKGSGRLQSFPYPLENFAARAEIRDDYVDIPWAHMKRGDTELSVSGRVRWKDFKNTGEKIGTNLKVAVKNMPIDQDLFNALTPMRRKWLQAVGLGGKLDFSGRVFSDKSEDDIVVDLGLALHDGTIWPGPDGKPMLAGINGKFHLDGDQIELDNLTGHRGEATMTVGGLVSWKDDKPRVALKGSAENLPLDEALYKLLPASAHETWDAIAPVGTIDADATYAGGFGDEPGGGFTLTVRPRKLSVMPKAIPYRLEDLSGAVSVADGKVTLKDLTGHHGAGSIAVSGVGAMAGPGQWTLSLKGKDLAVDKDFLKGVPDAVAGMLRDVEYKGPISFDLSKLTYRAPATTQPAGSEGGDIDFAGVIGTNGGQLVAGVPMTDVHGKVDLRGAVRGGRLAEMQGAVAVDSMKVAGRDAQDVKADLAMPAGDPVLHIGGIRGDVAGGAMAGEASVSVGGIGPAHYKLNMVLRDADVRAVAQDNSMNGDFTASMDLEGTAGDPKSRIGRGDVLAKGKDMYQVPLLMGLLQITNLSLPFTTPFKEAQAQYILQGNQMTFENIELHSESIVMRGSGTINFDDKKIRLTFNTDSPTHWLKLPIVQEFWQSAKRELFQIDVRGTVQDPKVSASPFHTVTTTVQEVLHGGQSDR